MNAIFGLFRRDGGPVEAVTLRRMSSALVHRGSSGSSLRPEVFLGLGYRTDGMRSPTVAADPVTGAVVAADARIDDRAGLARMLGASAQLSDPELILAAYLRWGGACPQHLVGDFSFVVWDPRTRTLFCARDPMGVRPLYFHLSSRQFAFATEIKGVHAVPEVPREVDDEQAALFLAGMEPERDRTLYAAVNRVPAAHTLSVSEDGQPTLRRYWSPEGSADVRLPSGEEYVEAFRELLSEAVRCRLDRSARVATALSGGLDSSAVTCIARQALAGASESSLHAISLIFPGLAGDDLRVIDERTYVDRVVAGGGLQWHPVRGDHVSPLGDVDDVLRALDLPYAAPNLYLHRAMYRAARDSGAAVFLDGLDGDTTVSHGFGRLNGLLAAGDWNTFEGEVRSFARHRGVDAAGVLRHFGLPHLDSLSQQGAWRKWGAAAWQLSHRFGLSRSDVLLKHGIVPALPAVVRAGWEAKRAVGSTGLLRSDLASLVRERLRLQESASVADERAAHVAGLALPAYQTTLEMADASAAAFAVEPRYPFFDRRLIEFCVGVPEELKFANGWGRLVFRRAMEGVLPPEIQWRTTKSNLSPNFQRQFTGRDRPLVTEADLSPLSGLLNVRRLEKVRQDYFAQERGWGDPDAYLLLRAVTLARWRAADAGTPAVPQAIPVAA